MTGFFCRLAALAQLLSCGCASTVKKSTAALAGISIDVDSKEETIQICGAKLFELLKHPDMDVVENARVVILNACENPTASSMVQEALTQAERDFFLGPLNVFAN